LSENTFIGPIPSSLGLLTNLTGLDMHENQINGFIPPEVGMLNNLAYLNLSDNKLIGPIPSTLGHLSILNSLDLSRNQISGPIPLTIGNLTRLLTLKLSANQINCSIPVEIEHLRNLAFLYLDHNNIIGQIPTQLRNFHGLQELDLSHNFLSGEIPVDITANGKQQLLDISYNSLTGNRPHFLTYIPMVNLSYNSLKGPISSQNDPYYGSAYGPYRYYTLIGNKDLCGGNLNGFPPCPHKPKLEILVPIAIFFGLLVLGGFLLSRHKVKKTQSNSGEAKNGNLFSIWNYDGHIAYEDIIEATEDFDIKYCIGIGGYGSIYKAELPCGKVIALKKLHRLEAENPTFDMSFRNEVKVLIEIRH
jgi:hypothetical protein